MPTIVLLPDGITIESLDGEAVLDAMRRCGVSHRFGCRRGGCGICKVDLVDGSTHDNATVAPTVLTDEERAGGVRLSCRAVPDTDVVIRLRADDRLKQTMPWFARATSGRT